MIANSNGCILDNDGKIIKAHYAAGWIKTGPIGVLDTTYVNAVETCNNIMNHMHNDVLETKFDPYDDVVNLL